MKQIILVLILIIVTACDSEDAGDCFQKAGSIIQEEIPVSRFDKILVNRDIELIISQGAEHKAIVETGENLLNDVQVIVENGTLTLTDNNTCNYVREYGITKIYVTAPELNEIRSSTQYDISSEGILNFENLVLLSEEFTVPGTFTMGDFRLEINCNQLRVTANGLSSFYISGIAENANIGFYAGAGRFEGANLISQNITITHRGSNDMVVNPILSLKGTLMGTGNLIAKTKPPVVDVEQLYSGRLIFE